MNNLLLVPVKDFPNYLVSFEGIIYKELFRGGFTRVKQHVNHGGYMIVRLRKNNKPYARRVHLLTWTSFIGKIPFGYQVNHKLGIKSDNGLMDLDLMTQRQNLAHSLEHGLRKKTKIETKLDDCQVLTLYTLKKHSKRKDLVDYSKTTIRNVEMILSGQSRKKMYVEVME